MDFQAMLDLKKTIEEEIMALEGHVASFTTRIDTMTLLLVLVNDIINKASSVPKLTDAFQDQIPSVLDHLRVE